MLSNIREKLHIPYREDNLFGIVFLSVLIIPLIFIPIYPEGYETVKYALLLILSGAGGILLAQRFDFWMNKTLFVVLGAYWLLHIFSTIFAIDKINSFVGLYGRYTGSMIFVTAFLILIAVIINAVRTEEDRRIALLKVLVFDGLAIAVLGVTQYFNIAYYGGSNPGVRPIIPSFIGNQNFFAMFLLACIPASIILFNLSKNRSGKLYYAVSGLVMLWAMIVSGSRGGLLGFAGMIGVLVLVSLFRRYGRKILVASLISLAVLGILYSAFFAMTRADSINGVSSNADYTAQTRYVIWSDTIKLIPQYALLGTGSGNFFIAFEHLGDLSIASNERFDDAHNLLLHLAITEGLPSLLLFLGILIFSGLISFRKTAQHSMSALWLISSLAGVIVAASFNPVSVPTWLLFGLFIAFAISYEMKLEQPRMYFRVIFAIVSVLITIAGLCFIASETFSTYGLRAYHNQNNSKTEKLMHTAVRLNPFNSTALMYLTGARINLGEKPDQALQDIQKIINQHPDSSGIYKTTADLTYRLYDKNNKDEQLKQKMDQLYEKAVEIEPNSANLYGSAAYAFYKTGQTDKSIDYLNHMLALPGNEDYPYSWILLAKISIERGDKDTAVKAMEKAYSRMTDQPLIKYYIIQLKDSKDISKLQFPVAFPDIDI
ncbi:MAG TPA: O-antigen ligase family protein [Patescibacteria group bacterium]|jgi:O-antigen ligase/Tfp pilus assembly protein PilF|nr:O-antigen ligase family protein [Patescibacteria group bacterium]